MQRSLITLLCVSVTASSLLATPSAQARPFQKEGAIEVSLQLGGLFFLDEDAVPFDSEGAPFPEPLADTFAYTLSGTYNFTRLIGAELSLQLSPAEVNRLTIFTLHLDAVFHPLTHDWFVPFVGAGLSFSTLIPQDDDLSSDPDPGLNLMVGVKLYPWRHVGFRIDLRYLARIPTADDAPDGRSETFGHDLIASFGFLVSFGGEDDKEPVLLDTDGDGILDQADACPKVPGVASAQGCPDKDGDTITDAKDRCPDDAGPVEYDGCPDGDGDTIVDKDDRCPTEPGPKEHKGCPDDDADKIANLDDRCPKIPGEPAYQGCPPPPPDEVVKRFSGRMDGITFEVAKDIIRESSFETLDDAVETMKTYPQLRVLIEGHTSSEGERAFNMDLSRRRAEAVKAYMVDKDIAGDRLETKGFGPDKPTATNDTEEGRALNRRIEFKILRK